MTYSDYKALEDERDHTEWCQQERLRKALRVQNTGRAGWRLTESFWIALAVLAAMAVCGSLDMQTAKENEQEAARLNTLGGREE